MKKEILPNHIEPIATTDYISGQEYYDLPYTVKSPVTKVEVFNRKKKTWESVDFSIVLSLNRKKLKTDNQIKIYYDANRT